MATVERIAVLLCFAGLFLTGSWADFIVTHAPDHVQFIDGATSLKLSEIQNVISSTFGYDIKKDISWDGLGPGNVFQRPKANIVFSVEGLPDTDLTVDHVAKYNTDVDTPVLETEDVVNKIVSIAEDKPLVVDFSVDSSVFEIRTHQPELFRHVPATYDQLSQVFKSGGMAFTPTQIGSLNASNTADLFFLGELHMVKEIVKTLKANPQMMARPTPDFFHFKIRGVEGLRKEYGIDSVKIQDAISLIQGFIQEITAEFRDLYKDNVVVEVVTIPINADVLSRKARSLLQATSTAAPTPGPTPKTPLNLAEPYDEMFPVIFNIILWLGIIMTIGFIGIAYGIWFMDPGRDSIIYRMTSQRIKKD